MAEQLRVAVLSRHELTRAGLAHLVQAEPDRVRVVKPRELGTLTEHCDAVVYDLATREPAGDVDLRALIATEVPVIVLMPGLRPDVCESVLLMGAAHVVTMDVTATTLLDGVEQAAAGHRTRPNDLRTHTRAAARRATGLTEREITVLELIATGLSNAQIAAELYLSINSVKTYIRQAYRRIGVSSRSQAVIWATRQGFGPVAEPGLEAPARPASPATITMTSPRAPQRRAAVLAR